MPGSVFDQNLARGKVEERKIAAYLKALGYRVLPTTEFSGSGAPKLEAESDEESLVMPDLQAFLGGGGAWFESKWKARATLYEKHGRATTGISLRHFSHYCRIERETKLPVAIVFVHEAEREVRCGTLAQLESVFSHDYRGDKMDRGGMRFWIYERIPLWMPLGELAAALEAHQLGARLVEPIAPPVTATLLRQGHAQQRHGSERSQAPWTWAHLICNTTGTGSTKHRCEPQEYLRNVWIDRLRWGLDDQGRHFGVERARVLIEQPLDRGTLIQILGSSWDPKNDSGRESNHMPSVQIGGR